MSKKKEDLYKLADEIGEGVFATVIGGLLSPQEWRPVVFKNGDHSRPYMRISGNIGGMVLISRWANANELMEVTEDDMADMIIGSDGRATN